MPMAGVAGQRLPGSSQPSQHRSEGAAGTSSSPSASFFQFPMGHQMLLPRCHLLGEMRRSKAEWRAGESREGRKQWERQFSLIWTNPLPAKWSQRPNQKKNNSFPASRQLKEGFPQPVPQSTGRSGSQARCSEEAKPQHVKEKAPTEAVLAAGCDPPPWAGQRLGTHHCSWGSISDQRPRLEHGRAGALVGWGNTQTTYPQTAGWVVC